MTSVASRFVVKRIDKRMRVSHEEGMASTDQVSVLRAAALAHRADQRMEQAAAAFKQAVALAPDDPELCFALAQVQYERGLPTAALFAHAWRLAPGNLVCARNQALAMISEGQIAEAHTLLTALLAEHPYWLDGHKVLATLNWTRGDQATFADHFARALAAEPRNADLWLAWFRTVAQTRDWGGARAILDHAERQLGETPALVAARLFVAVEANDAPGADVLIAQTASFRGDVISLCRIRHALRHGDAKLAGIEAALMVEGPSAALYWPYLSMCWRLLGDARWEWLDRPDDLIGWHANGLGASELTELADLLCSLHTAQAPYAEQSVRGGTQTDRSILLRHEPQLQRARRMLLETVREYVAALPPHDAAHPLLSAPREHLLIEGSWSVRLERQGHNVPHTHAMGWLSTAFYVALPSPTTMGAPPAGHIEFGRPPPELGLDLLPYRTIAPVEGQLAIFPSTMWHSTVPFADGERLVIAFDVKRPRY